MHVCERTGKRILRSIGPQGAPYLPSTHSRRYFRPRHVWSSLFEESQSNRCMHVLRYQPLLSIGLMQWNSPYGKAHPAIVHHLNIFYFLLFFDIRSTSRFF